MYAASFLRQGIAATGEPVQVIATRPAVPAVGMEERLGQEVAWIDPDTAGSFAALRREPPALLFVSGWHPRAFRSLAVDVNRSGGRVVVLVDNRYRGDLRQRLGGLYFRTSLRKYYDHAWVPGASARRLMRAFGMPEDRITTGLYSADTEVFASVRPLSQRPVQFAFVGQFIERKNVRRIRDAFAAFQQAGGAATLVMQGSGPLQSEITPADGLFIERFGEPRRLANLLNQSRAIVLPSIEDHWPLAVHEAAACGCLLILSESVGSIPEFATQANARVVRASRTEDLVEAFRWAVSLSGAALDAAGKVSEDRAAAFSPARWATLFCDLCDRYLPERAGRGGGGSR